MTALAGCGGGTGGSQPGTSGIPLTPVQTSTSLQSSQNPSMLGQAVILTATVSVGAASGIGTVSFRDGATLLGVATVASGQAALSVSSLGLGAHAITATFNGGGNFAPSTSPVLTLTVVQDVARVELSSSVNPSVVGQAVTFTATVSGSASGSPSGTVTFFDGASALGPPVALSGGQAAITTANLSAGTHDITANYGGDAAHQSGVSAPFSQTVGPDVGGPSAGSSANPSVFGQTVTFTAVVTAPAGATPTGTVTFMDGAAALSGPVALTAGQATFSTASLAVGSHAITVVYSGDATHAAATSPVLNQTVAAGATLASVASSQNPSSSGLTVTFTATVAAQAPSSGAPSGSVTFFDGATPLGPAVALSGGQAMLSAPALATRTHPITVSYGGDGNFSPSTSAVLSQAVTPTSLGSTVGVGADHAGNSVAISADGRTVVVGAPSANLDMGGAFVFVNDGTAWVEQVELSSLITISPPVGGEQFGSSVAVSGNTVVVGAPQANGTIGRAYVFTLSSGVWTETAELDEPSGAQSFDFSGSSVAIDGSTVLVGAVGFTNSANFSIGAAFVYDLSTIPPGTASSAPLAELDNPQSFSPGNFGSTVALSGTTAVIGAQQNISAASSNTGGAAYVFTGPGGVWSNTPSVLDVAVLDPTAQFGASVAISGDAASVIVGAPGQSNHGDAYVFTLNGTAWQLQASLAALIPTFFADDNVGISVGISGNLAVAGSPNQNNTQGGAFVFSRNGATWSLQQTLGDPSARPGDAFATSLAMSGFSVVFGTPESFTSPSAGTGRGWFEILGP